MKLGKAAVRGKATLGMEPRFEPQNPTSYSGLILFQHFFSLIGIKERLWRYTGRHVEGTAVEFNKTKSASTARLVMRSSLRRGTMLPRR